MSRFIESITDSVVPALIAGAGVGFAIGCMFMSRKQAKKACNTIVKFEKSFNSDWKPGQKQPMPFKSGIAGMKSIDPATLRSNYRLVISAYAPRPIAFVSTLSSNGTRNLAPYSYSGVVGHNPPTLCFSVCHRSGTSDGNVMKDTLTNVLETKEFTMNMISAWFVEAANHCAGEWGPEILLPGFPNLYIDEIEYSGLTAVKSDLVAPPLVGESAVSMECKLVNTYELKDSQGVVTATMVFGEVVRWHIHEEVLKEDGSIDVEKYQPVGRIGGSDYAEIGSYYNMSRPRGKPTER